MDVTAYDAIHTMTLRFSAESLLEFADEIDCVFDFELDPPRQGPIRQAEETADTVEICIYDDGEVVGVVSKKRQPARMPYHQVKEVAVYHEVTLAIGGMMDRVLHHFDAAEVSSIKVPHELVVVSWDVDHSHALASLAQKFLDHIVVSLWPIPAGLQLPAVDDVADEVDYFGFVSAQEVQQFFGLTSASAEV